MGHQRLSGVALKLTRKQSRVSGFAGIPFEQLSVGLRRYLLRRARNAESAEDLEQEVYLRLLRVADDGLVRSPEAYVYRIASHLLGQHGLQERQSRVDFDSEAMERVSEALSDEAPLPEEVYDQQTRERWLAQIVMQLPPMQKAVFVLARYENLSHAEIAQKFGISVHTVKKHMLRAICHCREALGQSRTGIER